LNEIHIINNLILLFKDTKNEPFLKVKLSRNECEFLRSLTFTLKSVSCFSKI